MINQSKPGVLVEIRAFTCPSTVKSGDAVLIGKLAAVAREDYDANTGQAAFALSGSFLLTVIGQSVVSPQTTVAINPGDVIYAAGTLDSATNVTTGLTLDKVAGGTVFGTLDQSTAVGAGSTAVASIKLKDTSA